MRLPIRYLTALIMALLVLETFAVAPVFAASVDAVDDGTALAPFQFFPEDAPATALNVIENDFGFDGSTSTGLTITGKTNGAHGTVAIDALLRFVTYHPNANDSGADSFTYTVSDGITFDTATVYVSINALNDAPSFTLGADPSRAEDSGAANVAGFAVGDKGGPEESAQVLTYIIDSDSNAALFSAGPAISSAGDLTFTPAANANGSATITVHVEDNGPNGGGDVNFSPPKIFHITITAVNDAPVATADGPYLVREDSTGTVNAGTGVLANDTDIDTAHGNLTTVLGTNVTHGTLALHADGSFVYTPTAAYVGADSFTYRANDGALNSNLVTVTLTVYLNNAPVAVADSVLVVAGSGFTPLSLLTNDNAANPDVGEILKFSSVTPPSHGAVAITGGGTGVSYRPAAGFHGTDSFTYTISDGGLTATTTVTVHVPKDTFKPISVAPVQTISSQTVGSTTLKVHLSWTGTDLGSGISTFEIWRSTDGHAFTKIKSTSSHSMTVSVTVGHTYRFRVRAIDKKGNIGHYAYGPAFKVVRYQETSLVYAPAWTNVNSPNYLGGHARRTSTAGASASLTVMGRTFSWVGVKGPARGTADVYVGGVLRAHVNLNATSTSYRRVIFSITFGTSASRTIQIVYTGPSNRRIDADAIIVLR